MGDPDKTVSLWLVDAANEFQQMLKAEAEGVCRKAGLGLTVHFTGYDVTVQVREIRAALSRTPHANAFLVMGTRDRGLAAYVRQAVREGVAWFFLNGVEDDLAAIRRDHPAAVIAVVTADERETGRIQGRQFRALIPGGRLVLYVQGGTQSFVARARTAGVLEATKGAPFEVALIEGGWDPSVAREHIRRWLSIVAQGDAVPDLVACQNDPLAVAALEALQDVAESTGRPEIARIPVTGCDGTPKMGQRLVREGTIKATVVLPPWAGVAAQQAADFLLRGQVPPPMTLLKPTSFPAERDLRPVVGSSAP
jgi:ABC-type sugar transport system substrate-binding protein